MEIIEFKIPVKAADKQEAQRKAQAGANLINTLSLAELERLAHVIQHDPQMREMAKRALGL